MCVCVCVQILKNAIHQSRLDLSAAEDQSTQTALQVRIARGTAFFDHLEEAKFESYYFIIAELGVSVPSFARSFLYSFNCETGR